MSDVTKRSDGRPRTGCVPAGRAGVAGGVAAGAGRGGDVPAAGDRRDVRGDVLGVRAGEQAGGHVAVALRAAEEDRVLDEAGGRLQDVEVRADLADAVRRACSVWHVAQLLTNISRPAASLAVRSTPPTTCVVGALGVVLQQDDGTAEAHADDAQERPARLQSAQSEPRDGLLDLGGAGPGEGRDDAR